MFVACTMVRAGCSDEEVVGVRLNKENGIDDHIRDARHNDQARLAYAWPQTHRARERPELDFELADKGTIESNQQNIRVALAKLGVEVSYNCFAHRLLIADLPGFGPLPKRSSAMAGSPRVPLAPNNLSSHRAVTRYASV